LRSKLLSTPLRWVPIGLIFLVSVFLGIRAMAGPRVQDLANQLEAEALFLPDNVYDVVAWLSEKNMVLAANEPPLNITSWYYILFNTDTGEQQILALSPPGQECEKEAYGVARRLPSGGFGTIHKCWTPERVPPINTLITWDPGSHEVAEFYRFPVGFDAGEFALNPDLTTWLQEEGGDGIHDTLHLFDTGVHQEQLFPEFARAGSPAWSADGRFIAFAAIPSAGSQVGGNLFSGLPSLQAAMYRPWNLYIQESIHEPPSPVLEDIVTLHSMEWSPTVNILAFRGEYRGKEGIWLIDSHGSKVVRVWAKQDSFEWSPDGTRLLLSPNAILEGTGKPAAIIDVGHIFD